MVPFSSQRSIAQGIVVGKAHLSSAVGWRTLTITISLDAMEHSIQNAPMKQCPECSADYADSIGFCAKDGRALVAKVTLPSRLCPHCANSIPEDSVKCPYCKADLAASSAPQWPNRQQEPATAKLPSETHRIPTKSKIILIAGIVVFALGVFLIGSQKERSESQLVLQQKSIELAEREKSIQEKEQKIRELEKELAQARQQLSENVNELSSLKTKIEESKKDLTIAQQRLGMAHREIDRLASSRTQAASKGPTRPVDQTSSASPTPARRAADPGIYETVRATTVYEGPSASGRVVSQIGKGTKVDVVRSVGEWLEVRSKHGNPPGFIRWDDAMFITKTN
jgi:hypothetical protein